MQIKQRTGHDVYQTVVYDDQEFGKKIEIWTGAPERRSKQHKHGDHMLVYRLLPNKFSLINRIYHYPEGLRARILCSKGFRRRLKSFAMKANCIVYSGLAWVPPCPQCIAKWASRCYCLIDIAKLIGDLIEGICIEGPLISLQTGRHINRSDTHTPHQDFRTTPSQTIRLRV